MTSMARLSKDVQRLEVAHITHDEAERDAGDDTGEGVHIRNARRRLDGLVKGDDEDGVQIPEGGEVSG